MAARYSDVARLMRLTPQSASSRTENDFPLMPTMKLKGLLSAEQTYQNAAIALIRARAQRYADTAALFQALGGGWWNRADAPPAKRWDVEFIP